ncbi:nodulation protein NodH [Jannaschia formosa]|uniref:nodulation protein NodH n=1 Tax=Jannaschia formosa TaxID=2259592 RepID=UPI000E1BD50D|nr:nodulation protein NodH [Jannaschia formosa]TFL17580.1 nodulation protein NodH [Jannaschia formosa]
MFARFDAFVLFAEMRTGSNHLEASLSALADVTGHGEVFNPVFIGKPTGEELFGIDLAAREADPLPLLDRLVAQEGLPGFRYFHDHDPRVLAPVLDNPRIAKVILTRNPLDSYVSLAIARETGQWRLTNPKMAKAALVRFDGAEFDALVARQAAFRDRVAVALQRSGQVPFWIGYDQIGDLEVLNGLAAFLGSTDRLTEVPGKLKRQNPAPVEEKVENPEEMRAHLARLDPFLMARPAAPDPAPRADLTGLVAAAESPLIHVGLPGGPHAAVAAWLGAVDGAPAAGDFDERGLRRWLRGAKGFTSFCVLRHPLDRAWAAWRAVLDGRGREANTVRRVMVNQHGVLLPEDGPEAEGFAGFLRFLGAVRGGQSALPVAPGWEGQAELLAGMAQTLIPQRVIREADAQAELDRLAAAVGRRPQPFGIAEAGPKLAEVYRPEHDDLAVAAYRRDYRQFGFRRWKNS